MRRFFNVRERVALYLAADGKCQLCGTGLQKGWHADHVLPHSKGGDTDIANAQALCPRCNLMKGSKISMSDRYKWQKTSRERYLDADQRDYLLVACPGAGKTTFSLTLAATLWELGHIRRIIVVVPSDALRTQWSSNGSTRLELRPYVTGEPVDKQGYHGVVTTYQSLTGSTRDMFRHVIGSDDPQGTLVILDEIHHADDDSSYGSALKHAFENASRRLLLTGTPWRTDNREKMPFVSFDANNLLEVDDSYDYGQAIRDGVCRPIMFPVVDGEVSWSRDGVRRDEQLSVNRSLVGSDSSDAMKALLDASATGGWLDAVLRRANTDLMSVRKEHPDAGGLVVAKDRAHAKQVAQRLQQITGHTVPVVVSSEDGDGGSSQVSRNIISRFRSSRDPWIVAVKMIAEGVDIPRLMVGVYATNVSTSMFFNQVVGRFVRTRENEIVTSRLYVAPTPTMWGLVHDVEKLLPHRLQDDEGGEDSPRSRESGSGSVLSDYVSLGSEAGSLVAVASTDGDLAGSAVEQMEFSLAANGLPTYFAPQMVAAGFHVPDARPEPEPEPRYVVEKRLREQITRLVGQVAHRCYGDHRLGREVRNALYRRFGCGVDELSLDRLESTVRLLEDSLQTGARL